jgi:hypothetical protein
MQCVALDYVFPVEKNVYLRPKTQLAAMTDALMVFKGSVTVF